MGSKEKKPLLLALTPFWIKDDPGYTREGSLSGDCLKGTVELISRAQSQVNSVA
ncbi:MAG: hypothetical protein LBF22_11745 [Deltaproteobacteria bacterium]|nr:hypothetical protein [Deltaproteobacteria bacterium]